MLKRSSVIILLLAALALEAQAQFESPPVDSPVQWRLSGTIASESGAPAPQPGDEIAVMYQGIVVGLFRFTSASIQAEPRGFQRLIVYGNNPATPEKDGPDFNDVVSFRYFESATGFERADIVAVNNNGSTMLLRYRGEESPDLPGFPFPDLLVPSAEVNLVLGREGDGSDGGDGDSGPTFDVNGDGVVDRRDAALVLRIITGNTREATQAQIRRADVNRDGVVDTRDVVAIMRAIHGFALPASRRDEITGR